MSFDVYMIILDYKFIEWVVDYDISILCRQASPHYLLPLQIDTLLVGGNIDEDVPCDLVHSFYDAAVLANTTASAVGDVVPKVELLSIENCGHDNVSIVLFICF